MHVHLIITIISSSKNNTETFLYTKLTRSLLHLRSLFSSKKIDANRMPNVGGQKVLHCMCFGTYQEYGALENVYSQYYHTEATCPPQ